MFTKTKILAIVVLLSGLALGQGYRYDNIAVKLSGLPAPFATITVCRELATGTPCTPIADIFSDPALTQPMGNPFAADAVGNFGFYAASGNYHVQISGAGIVTYNLPYINLGSYLASPKTLDNIRFASQFGQSSVGANIDAACADLAGANGLTFIGSGMGAGWSLAGVTSNCSILDARGNGGSTQTAYVRGIDFYNRITSVGAGLQLPSNLLLELDAYGGGHNAAGDKTQWQNLRTILLGRTIGERKALEVESRSFGKGDSIGVMGTCYDFGGYLASGDEGCEGGRFTAQQGFTTNDFPSGTVTSIGASSVTALWTLPDYLGEQRPVIITNRGVYSTGTVSAVGVSGPDCVVTGAGTAWAAQFGTGVKTNLFMNITGNDNGNAKFVTPIKSITDDTHSVIEYNAAGLGASCMGTGTTTTGAYHIYLGGVVQSFAAPNSGTPNPSTFNLSFNPSGTFQAGDTIQQPLGYNFHGDGLTVTVGRLLGETNGGGVYVTNINSLPFRDAFRASGVFSTGFSLDSNTTTGLFFGGSASLAYISSFDISAATQPFFRYLSSGSAARIFGQYDRTNDVMYVGGGLYVAAGDTRVSTNSTPQPNTQFYMGYNNAAYSGEVIAPVATPNAGVPMLDVRREGGLSIFRVEKDKFKFNNGADVFGYSDNLTTQKWGVTGSTGAGRFDGGVTLGAQPGASGGTVNPDGGAFKHKRLTTGSVGASSSVSVTLNWATAFADANYTVNVSVVESSGNVSSWGISSQTASGIVVTVHNNDAGGAHTGTLNASAVHD